MSDALPGLESCSAKPGSGGFCRLSGSVLLFGWAEHAEVRMAPVVDSLHPVADGELSGSAGGPRVSVVELDF
jgi:hypothetical protein